MGVTELSSIVEHHLHQLLEHCDSVQIFVTRHDGEEDKTYGVTRGSGNGFARRCQVEDWLSAMDEALDNKDYGDE